MAGSHGLGSRDLGAEYELLVELTSRILTLANVTEGRLTAVDSFDFVLFNRLEELALWPFFVNLLSLVLVESLDVDLIGDFFVSAVSFGGVSLLVSHRLE